MLRKRRDDERGIMLVITAFASIALIAIAALFVDVALWNNYSFRVQHAADAAALAGVVFMPSEFPQAKATALDNLARNGFTDNGTTTTITVKPDPANARQLLVDVVDRNAPIIFSGVFTNQTTVHKSAIAAYNDPVSVGSPQNRFGVGRGDIGGGDSQHFWAAINGKCAGGDKGDWLSAEFDSHDPTCHYSGATDPNPEFDAAGYGYWINIPATASDQYYLQIWDAGLDPPFPYNTTFVANKYTCRVNCYYSAPADKDGNPTTGIPAPLTDSNGNPLEGCQSVGEASLFGSGTTPDGIAPYETPTSTNDVTQSDVPCPIEMNTAYSLADDTHHTPSDPLSFTSIGTETFGTDIGDKQTQPWEQKWSTLSLDPTASTFASAQSPILLQPGHDYHLTVSNDQGMILPDGNLTDGVNAYALRLVKRGDLNSGNQDASSFNVCTNDLSVIGGAYDADCPTISADNSGSTIVDGQEAYSYQTSPLDSPQMNSNSCIQRNTPMKCVYLANIGTEYRGKTLVITVWDPDQGTWALRPYDPQLDELNVTFINGNGSSHQSGTNPGDDNWVYTAQTSDSNDYNGKAVTLEYKIPDDYKCDDNGKKTSLPSCWWYLNYEYDSGRPPETVHDRTTWSVHIVGDPVHLVTQ